MQIVVALRVMQLTRALSQVRLPWQVSKIKTKLVVADLVKMQRVHRVMLKVHQTQMGPKAMEVRLRTLMAIRIEVEIYQRLKQRSQLHKILIQMQIGLLVIT